jgi:leucyl-tRNA synthetase
VGGLQEGVDEDSLPVLLPHMELQSVTAAQDTGGTEGEPNAAGMLARLPEWVTFECPRTGRTLRRETLTMPQWAGSCWCQHRLRVVVAAITRSHNPGLAELHRHVVVRCRCC